MKRISWLALLSLVIVGLTGSRLVAAQDLAPQSALGTTFTYQGHLSEGDTPANGNYDFQFSLYDSLTEGNPVGTTLEIGDVPVSGGVFTVQLDFGTVFQGQALWLQVGVRLGGSTTDYTFLAPRQALNAAPYAAYALQAPWSGLQGTPPLEILQARVSTSCPSGSSIRTISQDGTVTCQTDDDPFWSLSGNANTDPSTDYIGTSDNQPLELRVNGLQVLRLEPGVSSPNLIGGYSGNVMRVGVSGATISGGGENGYGNQVKDDFGVVAGGASNQAGNDTYPLNDAGYASVGGGLQNTASGYAATVGGGTSNTAIGDYATLGGGTSNWGNGFYSTIGGGDSNVAGGSFALIGGGDSNFADGIYATLGGGKSNSSSGSYAALGGGESNSIIISGSYATLGGGSSNTISERYATLGGGSANKVYGAYATLGGGSANKIFGLFATLGGGSSNTVNGSYATLGGGTSNTVNGSYATVPGGAQNLAAGNYSFAAGYRANTTTDATGSFVWGDSSNYDIYSGGPNQFVARATGGFWLISGLDSLGSPNAGMRLESNSSQWLELSDRSVKTAFRDIDATEIAAKVAALPIQSWQYKAQAAEIRHIGPVAQDFYTAFGLGEDQRYIGTLDADGVSLAAIKGLYRLNQEQEQKVQKQEQEIQSLKDQLALVQAGSGNPKAMSLPLTSYLPWLGMIGMAFGLGWSLRSKKVTQ